MKEQRYGTRRMAEQRWLIDKVIDTVGIDFSWPMTPIAMGTAGPNLGPDIMSIRARVKKYADAPREFTRVATKREAMAKKAEEKGHPVTARDNYYAAAICYGMAQWAYHEDDHEENIYLGKKKIACYGEFMKNAPHPIERVEIPFEGSSLPGYLHLPLKRDEKAACVLSIDGMDNFKEAMHPLYGDKLLERGIAVLSLDGPGQGECLIRKIRCTTDNFPRAGEAAMDWLIERPEIDADKIGVSGTSMGSFWVTQIVAHDRRFKAAAVMLSCHEPGMDTIFNKAAPTFKERYMWMAGYDDEDEFDRFAQKLTLEGLGSRIKCPFLVVAAGDDELSPIQNSYNLYEEIKAPKKIVVFEGERHGISYTVDVQTIVADWIKDSLDGKPMASGKILIDTMGREIEEPIIYD